MRLKIIEMPNTQTARDALISGRCDAALAPLLEWVPAFYTNEAYRKKARLVCGIRGGSYRLLVKSTLPIYKLTQLAGYRIGITRLGGADQLFVSIWLRRHNLHPTQSVRWVVVKPNDMTDAIINGRVDAIVAHDPTGWSVLEKTRHVTRQLLGSTTGALRNRTDVALGLSLQSFHENAALAERLANTFKTAQHAFTNNAPKIISEWSHEKDAPPRLGAMLQQPISRHVLTSDAFRRQIEQYIDEFKLISLIENKVNVMKFSDDLCLPTK